MKIRGTEVVGYLKRHIELAVAIYSDSCDQEALDIVLRWASIDGHIAFAEAAVAKGANVNVSSNQSGRTSLHEACLGKHKKIVELLVSYGADINARTKDGYTPIIYASADISEEVNALSLFGIVAPPMPAEEVVEDIVRYLIDSGADIPLSIPKQADNDWILAYERLCNIFKKVRASLR